MGRQRFGGLDVSVERRLADLENTLTLIKLDPAENVPLLDMPLPDERVVPLAPEELRRRLAALTSWTIASARVQPVVLVFEDLHWADPTTLDVLHGLPERGALAPLFIVAAARLSSGHFGACGRIAARSRWRRSLRPGCRRGHEDLPRTSVRSDRRDRSSKKPSRPRSKPDMCRPWSAPMSTRPTSR
jgi:hypothetical protein